MAPSDAFSTAANVFSVVGLADIVFKYGREVCETLSKLHNVPNEIKELLVEIESVKEHAARVKTHLEDLARSSLPQRSKDFTAPLEAPLFHCQEELVLINKSISESTLSKQDGWLKKLRKNAKWVWDEQDITLARRRLERWRRELESTLTLAGRANDVSIYAEVASTRSDIAQATSDSKTAVSDLSATASSIENGVHTISATMDTFFQGNNAQLGGMKDLLLDTQGATNSGNVQVLQKLDSAADSSSVQCSALQNDIRGGVNAVRRDIHTMSQSMRQSRVDQTRKQRSGTRKMLNKLEEVNANMTQSFASLNLTRAGETAFIFEGTNLELVTLPLELLHLELVKAFPTLQSHTKIKVSQSEAAWVQQQFEMVRTASFELSANASRSRAAKGLPAATNQQPWRQQAVMRSSSACSVVPQGSSNSASRRSVFYQRESLETPLGCLNLTVIRSRRTRKELEDTELESLAITFCPSEQFRLPGISANFARRLPHLHQHIPPTIRIWNIVPRDSPAFAAAAADDVYALTGLFEAGLASPFDRTSEGYSLVTEAIKTTSVGVFKLLLEQGAGRSEIESVDHKLDLVMPRPKSGILKLHQMFSLLSRHMPDFLTETKMIVWAAVLPFCIAVNPSVEGWDFDFSEAELVSCLKSTMQLAIDNSIDKSFTNGVQACPIIALLIKASGTDFPLLSISRFYELLDIKLPTLQSLGFLLSAWVKLFLDEYLNFTTNTLSYIVELLKIGVPLDYIPYNQLTLTDHALRRTETSLLWVVAVNRAGFQLGEAHRADGKSLGDVWPDLLNDPWELPNYKKLIRTWDIDQLGDLAEIFLEQSSVLREAWAHGMDVDDSFLMGVASLWE